jgi:urease accessory protein
VQTGLKVAADTNVQPFLRLKMGYLRLLQVTDSAFPLGGYAFSYGLESVAKLGLIQDAVALRKYLDNVRSQITCGEIPYVNSAFKGRSTGYEVLEKVFRSFDSFVTVPSVRKASVTQGRSLLSVMKSAYPNCPASEISDWVKAHRIEPHFVPTFGTVANLLGLSHEEAVKGYFYMSLRDQTYAALRLGMLGPHQAQKILAELLDEIDSAAGAALHLEYHQAFKVSAVLEIAQAHHPLLYSRLFQS